MSYNPKDVREMNDNIEFELEELHIIAVDDNGQCERICEVLSAVESLLEGVRNEVKG